MSNNTKIVIADGWHGGVPPLDMTTQEIFRAKTMPRADAAKVESPKAAEYVHVGTYGIEDRGFGKYGL